MKYKFNLKLLLGAAIIAIFTAGCQLSSPTGASPGKRSDINLTDNQKAQMKQIREQTQAKILAMLSAEQQEKFKAANKDGRGSPLRSLRSLDLSADQKQKVQELLSAQRQQMQAILTPEQQAKMKRHR
ncbi:Spy/CpxP family protein refolding chaperone [Dendronalium sp. ChiSLP03b]|uniref:Spy/CpxP family protein refolding chaperone n=1 Tax=Dendronalium sp. ChiSLP03b TaxID=3075381 RepID=UPI002AD27F6E|nr:Spy/CpxP family protein refolding chaperone [Dendronalium sp. ChiSLP03b]MDZ8205983.1 Spy/CpxP family protein refolding chaperone [Dendronalium sp. ChiSLP03b]